MTKKQGPYAPAVRRPISAAEYAAQAERMAAEDAEHRRQQAEAEAVFRQSVERITPLDPTTETLRRLSTLELQVARLEARFAELDRVAEDGMTR